MDNRRRGVVSPRRLAGHRSGYGAGLSAPSADEDVAAGARRPAQHPKAEAIEDRIPDRGVDHEQQRDDEHPVKPRLYL